MESVFRKCIHSVKHVHNKCTISIPPFVITRFSGLASGDIRALVFKAPLMTLHFYLIKYLVVNLLLLLLDFLMCVVLVV